MQVSLLKIKADDDLAIELRDIIADAVEAKGFEIRDYFTWMRGTGLHTRKIEMSIVKRESETKPPKPIPYDHRRDVFFPRDAQIIYGWFDDEPQAVAEGADHNGRCVCDKTEPPAETKDQVAHDAKIKIGNILRRLRMLNVDDDFIKTKAEPQNELERFAVSLNKAFGKTTPSFNTLYQHLSAALREAERLAPVSQLTDDDSGEVD